MDKLESLSHTTWACRYHVVFIPKCRRKVLYGQLRPPWGGVSQASSPEGEPDRGRTPDARLRPHAGADPAEVLGIAGVRFIKGKSAIHVARVYGERKRNFVGQRFWARGYFVSTVGRDEAVIREDSKKQEKEGERLEQLGLWR